jgi:hypothetical protein
VKLARLACLFVGHAAPVLLGFWLARRCPRCLSVRPDEYVDESQEPEERQRRRDRMRPQEMVH